MKEILLSPSDSQYNIKGENIDQFLKRIGIPISESPDEHMMVSIRCSGNVTIYGFKTVNDLRIMSNFLIDNEINFKCYAKPNGARYPYHIMLEK